MTGLPPRLECSDRGAGPVALLVHGQPGQGSDWDEVALPLGSTHRVLVPDRPGYGRTGGPARDLWANAESLGRLLDEKGVDSATVVGHSFGGGVALALAQRRADRVSGLVLVSSVGTRSSLGPIDRALALPVIGESAAFASWELSRWVSPALRRRSTRLPARLRLRLRALAAAWSGSEAALGPATWRSFVTEQRALLSQTPALEAGLGSLRVTTAVVAGRRDRVVPPRAATDLAARIAGAELVWVPEAGHLVPQEDPALLVEIVRRYAPGSYASDR